MANNYIFVDQSTHVEITQNAIGYPSTTNQYPKDSLVTEIYNSTELVIKNVNSELKEYFIYYGTDTVNLPSASIGDLANQLDIIFTGGGGGGAITSVFGRVGVVSAQSGDYTASQVTNVPSGNLGSVNVQSALNELQGDINATNTALGVTTTALGNYQLLTGKGVANGYAPLDATGVIPTIFLPPLSLTDPFVVNSQAAMLALSTATRGDFAIRTDTNRTYVLTTNSPSTLADWQEVLTPGSVVSVNGQTGVVSLTTTNVAEGTNLYFNNERVDDRVASLLVAGTGVALLYNDVANTLTISSTGTYTDEMAQDAVGTILNDTLNIDFNYNDVANIITADLTDTTVIPNTYGSATQIPSFTVNSKGRLTFAGNITIAIPSTQITDFTEAVQDVLGSTIIAGTGITSTYNDVANTLTLATTITQYTDEQAQDTIGGSLVDSNTIDFTYNDVANTITADSKISVTAGNVLTSNATGLYVPTPTAETALTATDSTSIDFTTSGTANHTLTGVVKISSTPGNVATIDATGVFVASSNPVVQNVTAVNTTTAINLNSGNISIITMASLTANTSLSLSNPILGRTYLFRFTNNSTRNVTFPSFIWDDGLAFDGFDSSLGSTEVICWYDGTNYIVKL